VTLPSQEILRFLKKRQYAGLTPFCVDPPHREKYLPADPLDSSHDKSPPHIGFVVTLPSQEILRFLKKRQYAGLTLFLDGTDPFSYSVNLFMEAHLLQILEGQKYFEKACLCIR
jgi:hypothetical protein